MKKVITRFAPSPTGDLHIGGLRTALYAYALAKHEKGDFILRIEDTDKKREVAGGKEKIKKILEEFKIKWDEYYVQSERLELYKKAAEKLVSDGHAYEKEGAIRIKIPKGEKISFHDFVLDKEVVWETDILEDLVILKSDGFPTYHLASVVDDHEMKITHILRGHDWLPSTPIHLLLYKFLDYEVPQIGHLTDILDPEGGKLSKRKGSTSCEGLIKEGYLPEAILNFVMLLGWAPKDNREIFSLDEFIGVFDAKGLQKSNPTFNRDKLDWFNKQYIKILDEQQFVKYVSDASVYVEEPGFQDLSIGTASVIQPRLTKLNEYDSYIKPIYEEPKVDKELFGKNYKEHLISAIDILDNIDWEREKIDQALQNLVKEKQYNTGDFFMDLRIAVTGNKVTMPVNNLIERLGQTETLKRLRKIIS